ncbi:GNAT family N-acetyltransferase [Pseudomonas sp. NPDC008258]|uniref:GNAT family N-acetyltransferase n=1 Tax=unclassified Pseudomonas TaxID=196821 RepID=UPI0036F0A10F
MKLEIRDERAEDLKQITAVTVAAFEQAEHSSHTEQFIVDALREAGQLIVSLVAVDEDQVVGHVVISPVTVSTGAAGWYGLGPISVLPAWQGRGVGAALMKAALSDLQKQGAAGCVVLGDPAYYSRFGFIANTGLVLPGVPQAYFQALSFRGGFPAGVVEYHPAFNATE